MEIKQEVRNIERSRNDMEESTFKIEASGIAFKIMINGIYSNKTRAAVREIVCNALDETTTVMPEVHLPDYTDPSFRCRDFGPGLCHEDVMQMYTTVFKSTKKDNNDKIGGFGLGSKAPFAYTDGFTVSSVFEGVRRVYSLYINEDDCPVVALMDTSDTTEPSGLEVVIPVLSEDFFSFAGAMGYVMKHMPEEKAPVIDGSYRPEPTDFILREPGYGLRAYDSYRRNTPHVVMGNIEYPVVLTEEFYNVAGFDRGILEAVNMLGPTLYMELGDVTLAPSREALSYTKDTINTVADRLMEVYCDLLQNVRDVVEANASSKWEQGGAYMAFMKANKNHYVIMHHNSFGGEFDSVTDSLQGVDIPNYASKFFVTSTRNGKQVTRKEEVRTIGIRSYYGTNVHFMWMDPDGRENKVRQFVRQEAAKDKSATVILFKSEEDAKDAFERLGIPAEKLSKAGAIVIPRIPRAQRAVGDLAPKRVYTSDIREYLDVLKVQMTSTYYKARQYWEAHPVDEDDEFDFESGGFYVPTHRSDVLVSRDEHGDHHTITPHRVCAIARALDIKHVIGVRSTKQKKFDKADNWVNLYEFGKAMAYQLIDEGFLGRVAMVNVGDDTTRMLFKYIVDNNIVCDTPTLKALYEQESKSALHAKEVSSVKELAVGAGLRQLIPNSEAHGLCWNRLVSNTDFSMLKLVGNYQVRGNAGVLVDYMKAVEK